MIKRITHKTHEQFQKEQHKTKIQNETNNQQIIAHMKQPLTT